MWNPADIITAHVRWTLVCEYVPVDASQDDFFHDWESAYYSELAALGYEIPDEV